MNDLKIPTEPVKDAIQDITVHEKLVNGSELLMIYYLIIFAFCLMDIYLAYRSHRKDAEIKDKRNPVKKGILRVYLSYRKHGLITVNAIIYIICMVIIVYNIGFKVDLFFALSASFVVYTVFMKLLLRVFINKESYEDDATLRSINTICYILLGNFFCFYMSFITKPDLRISFAGLVVALFLCVYIMLHAIFNPRILQKSADSRMIYSESYGIIKGMLAVLICMLAALYMMVYSCYATNPGFYATGNGSSLDAWDLFYYLIISFTTIGYGDIVPVRVDGMFYSRFAAILIGLCSLFTTACFVAAVISTANSIAKNTRDKYNDYANNSPSLLHRHIELTESQIRDIINSALDNYNKHFNNTISSEKDSTEKQVKKKDT